MDENLAVNTAENTPNKSRGKPFVKNDVRINRKGRPRTFEAFRKLAIKIAGENADEEDVTRAVLMLREMSRSKNPADRALFLAYAYGKPHEQIDLNTEGKIEVRLVKDES